jgi:broad specificity phosphatase PhoE
MGGDALAPGTFDGDGRHEWCFHAPDGESYDVFEARVSDWLTGTTDHPALVVVTHGIVARVLRGLYAAMPRPLALSLPIPQDRVYRLEDKGIDEITVDVELSMPRITRSLPFRAIGCMWNLMTGLPERSISAPG